MYFSTIRHASKLYSRHISNVLMTCQSFEPISVRSPYRSVYSGKKLCSLPAGSRAASSSASNSPAGKSPLYFIGSAAIASALLGGSYALWKRQQQLSQIERFKKNQTANEPVSSDYVLESRPPYFVPARKVRNSEHDLGIKLTLYQFQTCPFCCKVRAFLDYYGFNYDIIEVNSVLRTQIKWSQYKKVPIVTAELSDGTVLQLTDSSLIISVLRSFLENKSAGLKSTLTAYPKVTSVTVDGKTITEIMNRHFLMYNEKDLGDQKKMVANERKWRLWVDNSLIHTLSPNIYRSPSEALQAFQWFDSAGDWKSQFSLWERYLVIYVGAFAMYFVGKSLRKRHMLKPDVRESLYDDVNFWLRSIKTKGTPFMGGDDPDLSDLAVYGVLSAIEGCTAFDDLMKNTALTNWYSRVKNHCKNHNGQTLIIDS